MNQEKLMIQRNRIRQLIEISNRHKNVLKWSPNESDAHIQMKLEICKSLRRRGIEFYTEAIFTNRISRADIVNADEGIIYEVYDTEKKESIEKKKLIYPLPIITVKANQEFKEALIL